MVYDAPAFGTVGRLSWGFNRSRLVYYAEQTKWSVESRYLVCSWSRFWFFLRKFPSGTWTRFIPAIQFLEYHGVFNRILRRIGDGIWNADFILAPGRYPG